MSGRVPTLALRRVAPALLALALVPLGCDRGPQPADPFPVDGFNGGWQRSGDLLVFSGGDLYRHIDGGAEVFLELGFDRLEVQRYTSPGGEVAVELYRMADPVAALGVYLLKCGQETADPGLGERHTVNPYQLQLVRGPAYLTVTRMVGEPPTAELVAFARHAAAALPAGDAAEAFAVLPSEGRVAGSERVVRGPFTLQEVVALGEGDLLELGGTVTAVSADYAGLGGGSTRLVATYPDEAAATAALSRVRRDHDPYLEPVAGQPDRAVFRDHRGRYLELRRRGAVIALEAGLEAAPAGVGEGSPQRQEAAQ